MGGGIGALILLVVALMAGIAVMLLTLNARWKTVRQLVHEARLNMGSVTALVAIGVVALLIALFVIWELL